ncbi:cytidylyltransferase domain-containing protein [Salinibacter ruber]|uniref:cytidylyltransferase domain-containing protein n=1 Tax=Salinibacter ruber TaxID=146919 RepID=UPI002166E728|nr:NTP transferase domain-containing protein [Salinibacter ruber]
MARKSVGIHIQCRLGSTRLPGKVLFPLGDRRLLEWVVYRCQKSSEADSVRLTVGDRPENDAILEWARRNEVEYDVGPEDNLLERHHRIAARHDTDVVVRVTGDCPLVPSSEIDRVIKEHRKNDALYSANAGESMPRGFAVDVIDIEMLSKLKELGEEHPVARLRRNPKEWPVFFTPNEKFSQFSELDVSVDTPDDYWRMIDSMKSVGGDPTRICECLLD